MKVRFGNSGDFHALVAVMRECRERRAELDPVYQLRPDADERFHRWVGELASDSRSMMLVAEEAGRIVGFLIATIEKRPPIYVDGEFALVREWWVDSAFQGGDVGRAMIDRASIEVAVHGVRQFRVCTPEADRKSHEQFERLGFSSVEREMVLVLRERGRRGKRTGARRQNINDPKTPM